MALGFMLMGAFLVIAVLTAAVFHVITIAPLFCAMICIVLAFILWSNPQRQPYQLPQPPPIATHAYAP